jgi:hypothetical protein
VIAETLTVVTPLGLRFHDAASGRIVGDGLRVTHTHRGRTRTAISNRAGVWVLPDLPGLREAQAGAGDDAYWAATAPISFELAVADTHGRYLPLTVIAEAPFRGVFVPGCGSPLIYPTDLPLFPAPTCPAAAGWGAVRAELREPSGRPAAWALLEVTPEGAATARGMADAGGRVLVPVPYPRPTASTGSPLRGLRLALAREHWPLHVTCRYGRLPADRSPELCRALDQPPATLDLSPPSPELEYGRELILRTPNRAEVLVVAASPL